MKFLIIINFYKKYVHKKLHVNLTQIHMQFFYVRFPFKISRITVVQY
jgi:hypothetical protein